MTPANAIAIADLPTAQFTAGAVAKMKKITISEAHDLLAPLVAKGVLTKKTAASGAINYKLTKGAANQKKAGTAAAKKTTSRASRPRPAASTSAASENKVERLSLAKEEQKALKAWEKNGGKGRRPVTPNLDAIEADSAAKTANGGKAPRKARKATGESGPRGTTVRFNVDDRAMPDTQNKLSSVAYQATKGIGGDDVVRISVTDLRDLLVKGGAPADPANTVGWSVTLPNGKVISTTAL